MLSLAFLFPVWCFLGFNVADGLTVGVMFGYWWYGVVHHVIHHHANTSSPSYFNELRAWHMRHHYSPKSGNFGVTTRYLGPCIRHRHPSATRPWHRMNAQPGAANPMRTDGFEFVEYAAPDPELLRRLFESMGLPAVARHRSKNVTLHNQGDINFIINAEHDSFAQKFARAHGPCACAMAFRVADARFAYSRALELGAKPGPATAGPMELNIPSIEGIGGSLIYLVDRYGERTIYDVDFVPVAGAAPASAEPRADDRSASPASII